MKILLLGSLIFCVGFGAFYYFTQQLVVLSALSEDDICGSVSIAQASDSGPVVLKSRPSDFSMTMFELKDGARIIICDQSGEWSGVIISERGQKCINRKVQKLPRPYEGLCQSGWIHEKNMPPLFAG